MVSRSPKPISHMMVEEKTFMGVSSGEIQATIMFGKHTMNRKLYFLINQLFERTSETKSDASSKPANTWLSKYHFWSFKICENCVKMYNFPFFSCIQSLCIFKIGIIVEIYLLNSFSNILKFFGEDIYCSDQFL